MSIIPLLEAEGEDTLGILVLGDDWERREQLSDRDEKEQVINWLFSPLTIQREMFTFADYLIREKVSEIASVSVDVPASELIQLVEDVIPTDEQPEVYAGPGRHDRIGT